jgi:hypothetical protein
MRWSGVLAVTVPPILLAALGLTHPHDLNGESAQWWMDLHILLLPVFPLLGVAHWVLLQHQRGLLPWIGRIGAFCYIAFYSALDAIVGIANGTIMQRSGAATADERPETAWLFGVGNDIGGLGAWSFSVASIATSIVLVRSQGRRAVPGAVVLAAASIYFAAFGVHIYWPRGVLTMLALAIGFGWLAMTLRKDQEKARNEKARNEKVAAHQSASYTNDNS